MIRSVNAAHLHSHSPSCFLAGCRGSPLPLSSTSLSSSSLPSSSCAHLLERRCRCCLCASVCVPAQGCSLRCCRCYRLVSLRAEISRWGTGALLGTTYRCNHGISRAPLQLSRHMQMRLGFNYGLIPLDIL